MSRVMQVEVCAAIRMLLASVPPFAAPVQQWADFLLRKAEVLDLIAAVDPCAAAQAGLLAARARQQAHALVYGYGDSGDE